MKTSTTLILAAAMLIGINLAGNGADVASTTAKSSTAKSTAPKSTAAKPTTAKPATPKGAAATPAPAPADTTGPGADAIHGLSFLTGKWAGQLRGYPLMMDIAIDGKVARPGRVLRFDIHATPSSGFSLPINGDYQSIVTWSEPNRSLRAVLTDEAGRGVELLGGKAAEAEEWLFNSTEGGAPFPFKVRLTPVTKDQVVVAYSSGGRMPLKYEVTFNRVDS